MISKACIEVPIKGYVSSLVMTLVCFIFGSLEVRCE
jgi:hypothetical protein